MDTMDRSGQGEGCGERPVRLSTCFVLLGLFCGLLLVAERFLPGIPSVVAASWGKQVLAALAAAAVATLLWEVRRASARMLTSLSFSVALLALLLLATAAGTVILQQAAREAYVQRHGAALASVLLAFGMDDLFHTAWFTGLLALLAASLVLTVIERRAWRLPLWGNLLGHLGVVVILAGGWVGARYGFRGFIDLHKGQSVREARRIGQQGVLGEGVPLGFTVLLEDFEVDHYKPEARFCVYEPDGEKTRLVRSLEPKEAGAWQSIGPGGAKFRLLNAYPDFFMETEVLDAPSGQGAPVLEIEFKQGDRTARSALLAGVPGRDAVALSPGGPSARFVWDVPSDAEVARFPETVPETHGVSLLREEPGSPVEEAAVRPGQVLRMSDGGCEIEILDFLPDFIYDAGTRTASTRSKEPRNPALLVRFRDLKAGEEGTRWLFAKMPDFGHGGGAQGPRLVYRHEPARRPAEREILVLGSTGEIWELARGKVARRTPLGQWQAACYGLPVSGMKVHPCAEVRQSPSTRSQDWKNPVADILLDEGGKVREIRLEAAHERPVGLSDGKTFLAFELRTDEPKAFRSRLAILEGGKKVAGKTVVVNDPLSYKGTLFYQADFRKEDPTYSGIQVVRDPGLPAVFLGFGMITLGVVFIYYIRPWILGRQNRGV